VISFFNILPGKFPCLKKYFSSYWIRSAFYSFLQRFSLTLFGFINIVLLTRTLDKSQMGTWAIFLSITGIFEATKSNLLKNAHIKYVSGSPERKEHTVIASSAFLINSSITIFFVLLVIFLSDWISQWFHTGVELAIMLRWFIPGMLFMIFFAHLEAVQQSYLDFRGGFAGYFIRQVLFCFVLITYKVLHKPISLASLSIYWSASIGLGTLALFLFTRKYLHFTFRASKVWVKRIFRYGGYIFGSGMVANISLNLDQLITGKMIDPGSVAYYNVASRINLLVDIPSYAASEIIFPKASRASAEEGTAKVKYLFERMVGILLAFTIPTAIFIILFPRLITVIIAGYSYAAAAPILQLYMITGIFRPAQNQAANLLNSIGKPRLVFIANTGTLLGFLGINYLCVKEYHFYGAAIGTLITTFISFVAWYFIMRKQIGLDLRQVFRHLIGTYGIIYTQVRGAIRKASASARQ
jgi:O-antigen/teichoic acid export membrane protein